MTKLKRSLGFGAAYAASTGLVVSGTAMVSLGNGFGIGGLAFAIPAFVGLVIITMVAISYGELASMLPGGGMVGEYTLPALGRLMAIIAVLGGYLVLVSADGGTQLLVAGDSFESLTGFPAPAFSFGLLIILLVLNISGVDIFARVQIPIVFGMMGILAIMGIAGLLGLSHQPTVDNPILNTDWGTLASMGAVAIWLYIGMEFVAPLAEEVHRPWKNIPLAMVVGVATIFVVDVLFGWGATHYADLGEMAASSIPHVVGATAIFGAAGGFIMTVVTILASFSTGNSYLAAIPRMLYGLANEGLLPKWLAKVSKRSRVPWTGMLVTAGCMAAVLVYSTISEGGIELIIQLVSIACTTWLLSYIIAQVDVLVLRRRYPDAKRPFRTPLYPVPQVIGILSCVYLIVFIVPELEARLVVWGTAAVIIAAIALFGIVWLKLNRLPLFTPTDLDQTQSNIVERSEDLEGEYPPAPTPPATRDRGEARS
ncbi:amino acid/polyamine/organocation transporter (APC superfamily) [Brevibacterium sanguinis]|uniref:Amino acid/polyamine/organocation transporter (APC superfamily) n=2 Tax=Brevibacterium TaxID=1696 RepID=A0A366IFR5_9MICO|nr:MULTISPECIES: APC family permease [Brevibacterium]RBP62958.1 amino acid/polyamine/organocation transporter (APC superfamily) [Brevibacterium sanguinis]RBP69497.1 amino acid/polyamine/organocation transporter (APC superfamily) [Brevibacterium celere]